VFTEGFTPDLDDGRLLRVQPGQRFPISTMSMTEGFSPTATASIS
jgi:hypothetical protein